MSKSVGIMGGDHTNPRAALSDSCQTIVKSVSLKLLDSAPKPREWELVRPRLLGMPARWVFTSTTPGQVVVQRSGDVWTLEHEGVITTFESTDLVGSGQPTRWVAVRQEDRLGNE